MERFHTISRGKMSLKHESTHMEHAFRFSVLLGSVRAREMHVYTVKVTQLMKMCVVVLSTIVTLKCLNLFLELILDISTKMKEFREYIIFQSKRINPYKMRKLIKKNNLLFYSTVTL